MPDLPLSLERDDHPRRAGLVLFQIVFVSRVISHLLGPLTPLPCAAKDARGPSDYSLLLSAAEGVVIRG